MPRLGGAVGDQISPSARIDKAGKQAAGGTGGAENSRLSSTVGLGRSAGANALTSFNYALTARGAIKLPTSQTTLPAEPHVWRCSQEFAALGKRASPAIASFRCERGSRQPG